MIVFPNAKINLGLEVLRERGDGYRDIESVFCPVDLCDVLEFVESSFRRLDEIHLSGLEIPGDVSRNLCVKVLELLRRKTEVPPQKIFIHKVIPMGAGLGGGSSDATFLLTGLNTRYSLGLDDAELADIAGQVGSDCPFFIDNTTALVSGRGETMVPVDCPVADKHLLIACPGIHIASGIAYAHTPPQAAKMSPAEIVGRPISTWKTDLRNRFEDYAFGQHPEIAELKKKMYDSGAVYASMTGSGSAVYGIFDASPPSIDFGAEVRAFVARPLVGEDALAE